MGQVILWVVISIAALVLDIITSGLFFAGFTIGGIFAVLAWVFQYDFGVQVVVFGIVSAVGIIVEYVWLRKKVRKSIPKTLRMEEEYIGRKVTVDEDIDERGKIKVGGIYWTAKNAGEPISKGDKVEIIGIEGNKLIIKK